MTTVEGLLTAEEFARLPQPKSGERMELVRGRVVMAPPADTGHGSIASEITAELRNFLHLHKLGRSTGEGGYKLATDPDVVRAPDAAWISFDRLGDKRMPVGFVTHAPNLAVEVVSTHDSDADVADKVMDWLAYGADRVWVVRPRLMTVTVHRPGGDAHTYGGDDVLTSADAGFPVEGLELPLSVIFG